jgi:hypothetical protein
MGPAFSILESEEQKESGQLEGFLHAQFFE